LNNPDKKAKSFKKILWNKRDKKKEARIEIQPRFKIQYPMKNRDKDVSNN